VTNEGYAASSARRGQHSYLNFSSGYAFAMDMPDCRHFPSELISKPTSSKALRLERLVICDNTWYIFSVMNIPFSVQLGIENTRQWVAGIIFVWRLIDEVAIVDSD
jgi:hypothetical protein